MAIEGASMRSIALLVCLAFLLSACQSLPHLGQPADARPSETVSLSPPPTSTALAPAPSSAELMEPYTILGLRGHQFQSGRIRITKTLDKTDVFTRYLISYGSDGLNINGIMQIPAQGHAPFPVIIMNHGFFDRADYASGDGTDRAAEYLNQHGYLTLASDYRSWGGSDVGPSLYYSGLAIDVVNLIKAVPTVPEADPSRIGMWGHSMGGGVTMKVLTLGTPVKAAVLYSTVSADDADVLARWGLGCIGDISAGEHQLDCNSSDIVPLDLPPELIKAYYEASKDPSELRLTSPIYHLDLVTVPVQINYGTSDGKTLAGTPPEWSEKLFDAFQSADKPAQIFAYEGEFHSFNGDNWIAFMERSAHFFDEYVKSAGP